MKVFLYGERVFETRFVNLSFGKTNYSLRYGKEDGELFTTKNPPKRSPQTKPAQVDGVTKSMKSRVVLF